MDEKIKKDEPLVLLSIGADGNLKVVSGMNKDGTLNTVNPTKENSDKFFEINSNGNPLENFMQKFSGQYETPSHIGLYAIMASAVDKISGFLDKIIKINPDDKVLDPYKVKPEGEAQEPAQGKYQPLDLNKVDWKEAEKLGISGDDLRDTLKAMAYGHKSPGLVDIKANIDGEEISVKARLSLEQQPDGSIKIQTHPYQQQPDFDKPFMGVKFTDEDIKQFQQTGNGGRVFDLEPVPGGGKVPSLVSLDKLTNRFEAMPLSEINIPQTLKNAPLSEEQQGKLKAGEGVLVEGMDKKVKPGEEPSKIDRIIQYNAANRNFDFRFTPEQREQHRQDRAAKQEQKAQQLAASTFRLQDICYTDENGESAHLYESGKTGSLTVVYSVDQVCEQAELTFAIGADEWTSVKGTDLKTIPVGTFATEVKQSRLLTYLSDIARDDENLVKQMKYNGACEWMEDRLVIHNGGVMYGPYLTMPPMQYKLCVEVNYEGSATPVLTVTKESGNVRLGEMQLKNGFNAMNLYLGEKAENLEFVLSNVTEEDIVVKKITFI